MQIHQLQYVVAVARAGSFSRAAEQCHVSQPSLSQQVLKLEDELGERLFNRQKRQTKLTAHGEAFLRRAVRILEEVDAAKREATDAHNLLRGTISVGVLPTIAPYLLPEAMAEFTKKYPGVQIIAHEDTTAPLLKLALAYEIDFALASRPINDDRLEVRDLHTEELLLALPPGHALVRKRTVSAADLDGERLIVMKEGHCLGDQVLRFCDRGGLRPQISFRSAQLETIQALVSNGLGISLVPAMAVQSDRDGRPKYRSVQSPRPERKIVAVWPRQHPPGRGAEEFLRVISDCLSRLRPRVAHSSPGKQGRRIKTPEIRQNHGWTES
jgi:LysR family hydrogen peroxide-inducible transcriptional activator